MIDLMNVRKVYTRKGADDVVALDNVTMHVDSGAIHGIVGQSGAGKSTLIRCLTALESPTEGSIVVDNVDMTSVKGKDLRVARKKIGMVFQAANLLDARTAAQNIAYPMQLSGASKDQIAKRVEELLETVGLKGRGDSYPSQLSGGQRQRVGIARALAEVPAVLLCDEPTSALDSETTGQILDLLKHLRDTLGVTILIITHEMAVVRQVCDSVTLLNHGKVVESGPMEQVLSTSDNPLVAEIVPMPHVDPEDVPAGCDVLDVLFTSRPGTPTGSKVLAMAASLGADVTAGTFESIGPLQVGRLALSVPQEAADRVIVNFAEHHIHAERRSLQ